MPLALQSVAQFDVQKYGPPGVDAIISHSSGSPLPLQSSLVRLTISRSSSVPPLLQS